MRSRYFFCRLGHKHEVRYRFEARIELGVKGRFLRRGDKIALFIGRRTSPLSKEQLTIFVMIGTKSEKHNLSKLEGIGSRRHDFLVILVINLLSSTAVVGLNWLNSH